MEPFKFFDCNCSVGAGRVRNCGASYEKGELLRKMGLYGIGRALVYHMRAREYDAKTGNKALADEIAGDGALYPVWVVMPHHTEEFYEPRLLKELLKQNGVRAVRIFPADGGYDASVWNCGELYAMAEEFRIPVFADAVQLGVPGLRQCLASFPHLKMVLTGLSYRYDRDLYALMKKYPGLRLETSGYKGHTGIEEICAKFGADRLVFGSGMPVLSGGSAVGMIRYARISDGDKRRIAYQNLETLLGEARYEH